MSIWDSYTGMAAPATLGAAPQQKALNTGIAPPQSLSNSSATPSWYNSSTWDINNPLAGVNSFQGTGFVAPTTGNFGFAPGTGENGEWGALPDTKGQIFDPWGTNHELTANQDGTYNYSDKFNDPSGKSNRDQLGVTYQYDPKTGTVKPTTASSFYQPGDWVNTGQSLATLVAAMATAGIGGSFLGASAAGGGGAAAIPPAAGATWTPALIDSYLGTAGYGASSASLLPGAATAVGGGALANETIDGGTNLFANSANSSIPPSYSPGIETAAGSGGLGSTAGNTATNALTNAGTKALVGAGTAALTGNGNAGGTTGTSGSGAGTGSAWDSFLNGLTGNGSNTGGLLSNLLNGYTAYQSGNRAQDAYDKQIANINGLYGTNSPYAIQMKQELERKDSAAGRNSQYGDRAVQLAAKLTDSKSQAINSANMTNLISQSLNAQNQFPATLNALLQGNAGKGLLTGAGNLIGSGASSLGNYLQNLFNGTSGTSPTGAGNNPNYSNEGTNYPAPVGYNSDGTPVYSNEGNNYPMPNQTIDPLNPNGYGEG